MRPMRAAFAENFSVVAPNLAREGKGDTSTRDTRSLAYGDGTGALIARPGRAFVT